MSEVQQGKQTAAEMEYVALREELLGRIAARQQVLSITLTLAGAFLGVGWNTSAIVMMLYPPMALMLAAGWAQNEIKISQLSSYIRDHLEPQIPGLGWERYTRQRSGKSGWTLDILSAAAIFVLTQLVAIGLGYYQTANGFAVLINWVMLGVDVLAVAAMFWLVNYVREKGG